MTDLEMALDHLQRVLEPLEGHDATRRHEIRRDEARRFLDATRRSLRATYLQQQQKAQSDVQPI